MFCLYLGPNSSVLLCRCSSNDWPFCLFCNLLMTDNLNMKGKNPIHLLTETSIVFIHHAGTTCIRERTEVTEQCHYIRGLFLSHWKLQPCDSFKSWKMWWEWTVSLLCSYTYIGVHPILDKEFCFNQYKLIPGFLPVLKGLLLFVCWLLIIL